MLILLPLLLLDTSFYLELFSAKHNGLLSRDPKAQQAVYDPLWCPLALVKLLKGVVATSVS